MAQKKSLIPVNVVPDPASVNPQTPDEFCKRGWLYFGRSEFSRAEADFVTALEKEPDNPEYLYALGLTHKASGSLDKALEKFEHIMGVLNTIKDPVRVQVLHRMVLGHINQIKTGDWNLEKEIWKSR
ncbi:MAG TPA: tetratricopeptide repeat protein [Anaerolineaceae bacterium]|nr:tetratricopeptide repeat protein [Anaerolineaceae bacterium]